MQLLFLLSFSALVSFFQGDFLVPEMPQMASQKNADASLCLGVKVRVKVFLEGPYAGAGLMNDNLRTRNGTVPDGTMPWIPTTQPYSTLSGFTHTGNESCNASVFTVTDANNAIVDWVFLELRDKTTPSTIIETRAALLQKDGDVVETDGTTLDISFSNATECGDFHIAVRHRNHLGARTNTVVALGATSPATAVDFTYSGASPNVYGTNPLKTLSDGNKGLYSGNVTQENVVSSGTMTTVSILRYSGNGLNNDRFPILTLVGASNPLNQVSGYHSADTDMNGTVIYSGGGLNNDRFVILNNVGASNVLATITEQL